MSAASAEQSPSAAAARSCSPSALAAPSTSSSSDSLELESKLAALKLAKKPLGPASSFPDDVGPSAARGADASPAAAPVRAAHDSQQSKPPSSPATASPCQSVGWLCCSWPQLSQIHPGP